MTFYYVTVLEEKGKFRAVYDPSEQGQQATLNMARKFGAEVLYRLSIANIEQGREIIQIIEQANKEGRLDKQKLEKLLE